MSWTEGSPGPCMCRVSWVPVLILSVIWHSTAFHYMHTIGNKLTGLLLFLLVPLCVVTKSLPLIPVALVIACSYLATFEEMLLILSRNTYDINTKSLLKK